VEERQERHLDAGLEPPHGHVAGTTADPPSARAVRPPTLAVDSTFRLPRVSRRTAASQRTSSQSVCISTVLAPTVPEPDPENEPGRIPGRFDLLHEERDGHVLRRPPAADVPQSPRRSCAISSPVLFSDQLRLQTVGRRAGTTIPGSMRTTVTIGWLNDLNSGWNVRAKAPTAHGSADQDHEAADLAVPREERPARAPREPPSWMNPAAGGLES
jgi:hypothetical protein